MLLLRPAIAALLLAVMGCATGSVDQGTVSPPRQTRLALAAARCSAGVCRCREPSESIKETDIAAGHKRFEFRLSRSTSDLWLEILNKGVFYKPAIPVSGACFYVDLPSPGDYTLRLTAKDRDAETGLQVGLEIHEYSQPHWYQSLKLVCGGLQSCGPEELRTWHAFQRKLPRGVLDPCGSAMIRSFSHSGSRRQRGDASYQDLSLTFALKVYAFTPYRRPHSPACQSPSKNRPQGQPQ